MEKREKRRDRTYRRGARRRRQHMAVLHPDGKVDCLCERSAFYFAKRAAVTCDCRGRKHGNPKVGTGLCHGNDIRPAATERIRWRREQSRWMQANGDEYE